MRWGTSTLSPAACAQALYWLVRLELLLKCLRVYASEDGVRGSSLQSVACKQAANKQTSKGASSTPYIPAYVICQGVKLADQRLLLQDT